MSQAPQEISTAPKDGTLILGFAWRRQGDGGERVWRCWWQPEFGWIYGARQMVMANGYTIDGKTSKLHSPDHAYPTHWLPYPDQPAAQPIIPNHREKFTGPAADSFCA